MSMCLLKRIVPFAAALTLGLFVASFFVTVSAPRFNFKRNHESRRYRDRRAMQRENQRLQEQIRQQQLRIEQLEMNKTADFESDADNIYLIKPPAPPIAPQVAPRRVK